MTFFCACVLAPATAAFAETRVGNERIFDAVVGDDGSAIVAVADVRRQEFSSRLLRVRART